MWSNPARGVHRDRDFLEWPANNNAFTQIPVQFKNCPEYCVENAETDPWYDKTAGAVQDLLLVCEDLLVPVLEGEQESVSKKKRRNGDYANNSG